MRKLLSIHAVLMAASMPITAFAAETGAATGVSIVNNVVTSMGPIVIQNSIPVAVQTPVAVAVSFGNANANSYSSLKNTSLNLIKFIGR